MNELGSRHHSCNTRALQPLPRRHAEGEASTVFATVLSERRHCKQREASGVPAGVGSERGPRFRIGDRGCTPSRCRVSSW
jgi:hypothetical protein